MEGRVIDVGGTAACELKMRGGAQGDFEVQE